MVKQVVKSDPKSDPKKAKYQYANEMCKHQNKRYSKLKMNNKNTKIKAVKTMV